MDNIPDDWKDIILYNNGEPLEKIFEQINKITPDDKLCPPKELIFEWARLTRPADIKVIIIGQDPYPNEHAHGLAFSSKAKKLPHSLKTIYKALDYTPKEDIENPADLTHWARQGVLLLNMALTTEVGKPDAHSNIWNKYTVELIKHIDKLDKQYTFMLWGGRAHKLQKYISSKHIVLLEKHPSPIIQNRLPPQDKFMVKCNHFHTVSGINWIRCVSKLPPVDLKYDYNGRDTDYVEIFTDGSCVGNGKKNSKGGFSIIFVGNKELYGDIYYGALPVSPAPTNIRAEGLAIYYSIRLIDKGAKNGDIKGLCKIYTDSKFWKDMINTYMPKWSEDDFKNKKNPDLTKKIWNAWNRAHSYEGLFISIEHVYAHNKDGGGTAQEGSFERWKHDNNKGADTIATYACSKLEPKECLFKRRLSHLNSPQ